MNIEQFYMHLESKGVSKNEYIRRVSLLFFAADLADTLSVELNSIMAPYGQLDGNIKSHVKKIQQHASAIVRHSDKTLNYDRMCEFGDDAIRFKNISFGWAGLSKDKPFLFSDLKKVLDAKTSNGFKVLTLNDVKKLVEEVNLALGCN